MTIKEIQQKVTPVFESDERIEKAWIFGSYARNENTSESDIDILVRFNKATGLTLFDYADVKHYLEEQLHQEVDMVPESGLREQAKELVYADAILVYERNR